MTITVDPSGPVWRETYEELGSFGLFRKTALTEISEYVVVAGTPIQLPDGSLETPDHPYRVARDELGIYPIAESVFQKGFERAGGGLTGGEGI